MLTAGLDLTGRLGLIFGLPLWTLGTSLFVLRPHERVRTAAAAA